MDYRRRMPLAVRPPPPWPRRRLALTVLVSSGCASWQPTPLATLAAPHPVRATYQLWIANTSHHLHAVRITADSVFGIPRFQAPDCARCTVGLPFASIDSVRTPRTNQTIGQNVLVLTLVAVGAFLIIGLTTFGGGAPPGL